MTTTDKWKDRLEFSTAASVMLYLVRLEIVKGRIQERTPQKSPFQAVGEQSQHKTGPLSLLFMMSHANNNVSATERNRDPYIPQHLWLSLPVCIETLGDNRGALNGSPYKKWHWQYTVFTAMLCFILLFSAEWDDRECILQKISCGGRESAGEKKTIQPDMNTKQRQVISEWKLNQEHKGDYRRGLCYIPLAFH